MQTYLINDFVVKHNNKLISYWFVINFSSSTDITSCSFEKFDPDHWMTRLYKNARLTQL